MNLSAILMITSIKQNQDGYLLNSSIMKTENKWRIVNDGVMGGISSSKAINKDDKIIFTGNVSLENNGGFASLRHRFIKKKIADYKKVVIHLKGDGKRYQFRAKTNKEDQQAYISYIETTGEWQTIEIMLSALEPTFRGRKLNMPNFPAEELEEVGFMIGNKVNENFELVIDKIVLE